MGKPQQVVIFALEIIHRVHLADDPSDAGQYPEAEALFRQTLEAQRRLFGANDESTLISVASLSMCLSKEGKMDEAKQLLSALPPVETNPARYHLARAAAVAGLPELAEQLVKEEIRQKPAQLDVALNCAEFATIQPFLAGLSTQGQRPPQSQASSLTGIRSRPITPALARFSWSTLVLTFVSGNAAELTPGPTPKDRPYPKSRRQSHQRAFPKGLHGVFWLPWMVWIAMSQLRVLV
jgi:hypothetical protein